jgi:small subunit ribosomal protein S3
MGRKVHPFGFRIGTTRDWQAKWYADKHYADFLQEDVKIRQAVRDRYSEAGVSLVEIERQASKVAVTIYTARPGIVIGRGGQRVDEVRKFLELLIDKKIQLNIQEIRQPELDAYLVARSIAEQIERRIAYRRAMKQSIFRTLQAGALGIKIKCSGRLAGAEIARSQMMHQGRVPLHTLRADVDYGVTEAHTTMGRIGIKVWIYRGDVLPEIVSDVIDESPFGMIDETDGSDENIIAQTVESPVAAEEAPEKPKAKRTTKAKAVEKEEKPEEKAEEVPSAETAEAEKPKAKRKSKAEVTVEEVVEKPAKKEKTADKPEETAEKPVKARAKKKDASEEA